MNMVRYYHYFLQLNNLNRYNKVVMNAEEEVNEAENYCQIGVMKMV